MDKVNWGNPPMGLFNFPMEAWTQARRFADYDLQVATQTHLTGEEYGAQIRAGAYDMGQIGTPVFLPAAAGSREYAVISIGLCNYAPFYLVASPEVESLRDCLGEPVVLNKRRTCPGSLLEWHARREGLTLADFQVVELMADSKFDNYGVAFIDGVERGQFRIGISYEPYASLLEREFGWRVLADYPSLLRPANYAILLYARRRLIETQPELVRRMTTAYFDAATDALAHVDTQLLPFAQAFDYIDPVDIERSVARESRHWNRAPLVDWPLLDRVEQELIVQQRVSADYRIRDYLSPLN